MAYITKKKLAEIINNAPKNVDKTQLLKTLVDRGNILEGYNEKKTGFLTNVARDIVSPFVKGAELLKNAGQAYGSVIKGGFQMATGNKEKALETITKAGEKLQKDRQDTIGVFGQGVKTIQNQKQAAGTALELVSNFVGGAGAKTALTGLKTPLKTVVKKLAVSGAKTGAKAGTLYGAGNALNQDRNIIGGAAGGALGGAVGGAILSPALGLAGRAVTQTIPTIKNKLLSSSEKRLVNIAQDLTKMTPTATKKEIAWGKSTPKFLVQERVLPLIESSNGKIKADNAISALKAKSYSENAAFKNILQDSGKKVSLDEWGNRLKQDFTSELKNRGEDLDNAVSKVDKEVAAYKKNYADKITEVDGQSYIDATDFNDIKSGLWQKSSVSRRVPGSELDSDVFYQMGHAAKELIEEVIDDTQVAKLNSRLGDFAQAIKVLESANGKVLPGGFIGKGFTKLAGTIAGAAGGGLPGSILGNITGGVLADIASNPKIRTSILAKVYNRLQKEGKENIIEEAQKILEQRGLERASRKLLEAPNYIKVGGKADMSRLFTQEEAQILLDSMKVKQAPKLLKAPLGDKTNPILLSSPKGKGETPSTKNFVNDIVLDKTDTNQFVDFQKQIVAKLTPEQKSQYLTIKKRAFDDYGEFDKKFIGISDKFKIKTYSNGSNLKSDGRAIEKAVLDEAGDFNKIKDMVRGAYVVNDFSKYNDIVSEIKKNFNVIRLKNRLNNPTRGYRDILINVKLANGTTGEIQILTPAMERAKVANHILYEEVRTPGKFGKLTTEEVNKKKKLEILQKRNYDKAWDEDASRYNPSVLNGLEIKENVLYNTNVSINNIIKSLKDNGGFTINTKTGKMFTNEDLYSVSPVPEVGKVIPVDKISGKDVYSFVKDNAGLLKRDVFALGGWMDDGKLYLDVVVVSPDQKMMLKVGKQNNQISIYNFKSGNTINTGGTGSVGQSSPDTYNRVKKLQKALK